MNVVAGHRTSHTHHMTLLRVGSRWALARLVGLADTDDDTDREFLGAWRRLVLRDKTTVIVTWRDISRDLHDVALALLRRKRHALMRQIAGDTADYAIGLYEASTTGDVDAVRELITKRERGPAYMETEEATDALIGAVCANAPIVPELVRRAIKIRRALAVAVERVNVDAFRAMVCAPSEPHVAPDIVESVVANDACHDMLRVLLPHVSYSVTIYNELQRAVNHNAVRNTLFLAEQLPPHFGLHWATCQYLLRPPRRVRSGALLALMDLPAVQPGQDMLNHAMRGIPFEPLEALLVATHPRYDTSTPLRRYHTRHSFDELLQPFDSELCTLDRLIMYAAIDLDAPNDSLLLLLMRGPLAAHTRFMKRECAKSLDRVLVSLHKENKTDAVVEVID